MLAQVLGEAAAIGLILAVIFALVHAALMGLDRGFSMSHAGMFLGVFLAGALGHLAFEYGGLNRQFCRGLAPDRR
jgi:hypothetical protein